MLELAERTEQNPMEPSELCKVQRTGQNYTPLAYLSIDNIFKFNGKFKRLIGTYSYWIYYTSTVLLADVPFVFGECIKFVEIRHQLIRPIPIWKSKETTLIRSCLDNNIIVLGLPVPFAFAALLSATTNSLKHLKSQSKPPQTTYHFNLQLPKNKQLVLTCTIL